MEAPVPPQVLPEPLAALPPAPPAPPALQDPVAELVARPNKSNAKPMPHPQVVVRGPPRWASPLAKEKVRRAEAPPNLIELLETLTAALPGDGEGPSIGQGTGLEGPPGVDLIDPGVGVGPARVQRPPVQRVPGAPGGPKADGAPRAPREVPELPQGPTGDLAAPLEALKQRLEAVENRDKTLVHPAEFVPANRKAFKNFIIQAYKRYRLAPLPDIPDPDACATAMKAGKTEVKAFAYQSFVRDYIQKPSPYRGVLVYHGLGSGKTCTSIAAMESLYQVDRTKPVFVLTPASLNPNYRDEITKCGPFIYRTNNYWTWVPVPSLKTRTPEAALVLETIGIPRPSVLKRKGAWLPDPSKAPNFESLSAEQKRTIQEQIYEHMDARIQFINYNGITEKKVREWACDTPTKFDGATMIVDEVHNLIRTINNSAMDSFYKDEPRDLATYMPKFCEVGKKYRISYLLYRMLCNSVGLKLIALSATPIINFPQEVAILANLLAGDTRMVEASTPGLDRRAALEKTLKDHPEVDFAEVIPRPESGSSFIRFTPVPSGYRKVMDPATGAFRGFIKQEAMAPLDASRERSLEAWAERVSNALTAAGLPALSNIKYSSVPRLPDIEKDFRELFIDTDKLLVKKGLEIPLMERLSGLISYYKGGKADLMAKVTTDEVVEIDMSDMQLKKYTDQRKQEIDKELQKSKKKPAVPGAIGYAEATKNVNSTFKIFSRAACNFVFPDELERPIPRDYRDVLKLIGAHPGREDILTTDDVDAPLDEDGGVVEDEAEAAAAAVPAAAAQEPQAETYEVALQNAVRTMKENKAKFFSKESLPNLSPKFQAVLDRLLPSKGPALVYSNFKTLEGVGLFSVALEAQQGYVRLDVEQVAGSWQLTEETMAAPPGTLRYIVYTGDERREKRKVLLDIFNAKWSKVPQALGAKVREITGVDNNIGGKIAKVFMITQSGAEGISLSNVRQVHVMEPYWNYVRLDQVKGRAIRICSHMELPPEERTVDVYTYISKFSAKQLKDRAVDETIMNFDGGETTDQNILKLMNAKKQLADSILNVMKSSAVDCELNATENGTIACYRLPTTNPDAHLFHPITEVHIRTSAAAVRIAGQ